MASGNLNILYKYHSMKTKWSRCFEDRDPRLADFVKRFFTNFYRDHRKFTFLVGELLDGTRHLLVSPPKYQQIKQEIEEEIEEILPEVAEARGAKIVKQKKSFGNLQAFIDYCENLRDENLEIEKRKREKAKRRVRELYRTLKANPAALILAFDLEVYEHDHSIVLEIGYVMANFNEPERIHTFHYIIEENQRYKNKDHLPDNRSRFIFGTSKTLSLQRAAREIQERIEESDFLVNHMHSGEHDREFLASCGVSLSDKPMFDTQILAMALLPEGPLYYSLKRLLVDLKIQFEANALHNCGNDAHYTMQAFLALARLSRGRH
ncbi:uncharacterized protein [Montipora foliosa]|uniref:uncharacterized protein n=1 Tax=Montipora foliosa TaxID=591990 RepID=UPI0035F2144E